MTATTTTRFTLEDINKIKVKGFDVKLPETTVTMVNKLAQLVGSPEYMRTPVVKNRTRNDAMMDVPRRGEKLGAGAGGAGASGASAGGVTDADWEALKNYKVTQTVPKDRSEADQLKRDIITELRKMTDVNYDAQKTRILELLAKTEKEYYEAVAQEIFTICTGNKFYADVYVKLYNVLCENNEIYTTLLDNTKKDYLKQYDEIKVVDPDKDYDLFCEVNKQNTTRIALSVFLTKILPREEVEELLLKLLKQIYTEFQKKDNIYVVDHYAENIAEMVEVYFKKHGGFLDKNVKASICNISMLQPRVLPSITNKIIFKFMDLEEMME